MGRNAQYRHRDGCREGREPSWDGLEDGDGEKWVGMHSTNTETGREPGMERRVCRNAQAQRRVGYPHGMGCKMGRWREVCAGMRSTTGTKKGHLPVNLKRCR